MLVINRLSGEFILLGLTVEESEMLYDFLLKILAEGGDLNGEREFFEELALVIKTNLNQYYDRGVSDVENHKAN